MESWLKAAIEQGATVFLAAFAIYLLNRLWTDRYKEKDELFRVVLQALTENTAALIELRAAIQGDGHDVQGKALTVR